MYKRQLQTDPIEVADEYIVGYATLAEELHRPYLLGYAESMRAARAHLDGRHDDMIRSMDAQLARTEEADAARAQEAHSWQMGLLLLDLDRVDDTLIENLAGQSQRYPGPTFGVMLALAHASVGRDEEARAELERLVPDDLARIPQDCMWAGTMAMLCRVVSRLGAVEYARPLYDLLLPYAERNCLWGSGFIVYGPTSRFLGMLATMSGEPDRAIDHLEHALERSHELHSPPLVARVRTELARALLARQAEGDDERARSLLDQARRTATELEMPGLTQDTTDLLATASERDARTVPDAP